VSDSDLDGLLANCQVRVHSRARHVRLRVDPQKGLIVTVPPRFDQRRLPRLLSSRAEWIRGVALRHKTARAHADPETRGKRPERILLQAIGQSWSVGYDRSAGQRLFLSEDSDRLVLTLPAVAPDALDERIAARLRRWLMDKANDFLSLRVAELATDYGLRYRKVGIRNQRARWGSCSTKGDLSLNARLLFCSPAACDYVITHELVHTRHPNHSADFWDQVAELMPDYRSRQDSLHQVWLRLPDWV
jgi:predicted metal-dependent hydrolase